MKANLLREFEAVRKSTKEINFFYPTNVLVCKRGNTRICTSLARGIVKVWSRSVWQFDFQNRDLEGAWPEILLGSQPNVFQSESRRRDSYLFRGPKGIDWRKLGQDIKTKFIGAYINTTDELESNIRALGKTFEIVFRVLRLEKYSKKIHPRPI